MLPIQDVLSRIRWDPEFAKGEFIISYYDRIKNAMISVPLTAVHFSEKDHFAIQIVDAEGEVHSVPLHRIREVHKDGVLIWQRHA